MSINNHSERFLTVQEFAESLKVHENTVYRWINDHTIEAFKFCDLWRIPISELNKQDISKIDEIKNIK
jgi:excisionase family DNA binding protein